LEIWSFILTFACYRSTGVSIILGVRLDSMIKSSPYGYCFMTCGGRLSGYFTLSIASL
jgi:hypothetical protein